jgi:hypothetical protein
MWLRQHSIPPHRKSSGRTGQTQVIVIKPSKSSQSLRFEVPPHPRAAIVCSKPLGWKDNRSKRQHGRRLQNHNVAIRSPHLCTALQHGRARGGSHASFATSHRDPDFPIPNAVRCQDVDGVHAQRHHPDHRDTCPRRHPNPQRMVRNVPQEERIQGS